MTDLLSNVTLFPSGLRKVLNERLWPIVKPLQHVTGQDPVVVEQSENSTIIKLSADAMAALDALRGAPTADNPDGDGDFDEEELVLREVILCNNGTPETVKILVRQPL